MITQRLSNFIFFFGLLLIFASCSNNTPQINMEIDVPNFGLHDHNGDFHTLYYYGNSKAVVLFTQSNGCSVVENDVNDLKEVRKVFKDKGVEFFMINSTTNDEREEIADEAEKLDFDMPVLLDKNQLVAEALQLHKSGEVLVLDTDNWSIAFRGSVKNGDTNYVNAALEALENGEYLAENYIAGKGTSFDLMHPNPAQFASISYEKDIAPMLAEKCLKCHVEGGIAPFAMKNYETVFGWSDMIREVVRTKRMPPWQADPHYGEFENDLSLSNEQLQTLVHWIDAGAKHGEGEDPLLTYHVKKAKWELGEPDMIVQLNKEEIPAKGIIDYRYQKIEIDLEEDVWATAIQVMPDNKEVLHHMIVSVIYPDGFVEPIDRRSPWLDGLLMAWAPGQSVEVFPKNTGRILPKGSTLHFQLHYTSNGKAQADQSSIGIYTTNRQPEDEYLMAAAFNPEIVMEPHDPNYENRAKYKFREETTLYSVSPHMHFRGKAMKFIALYPDGTKEVLLNVPNYNFNWQRGYRFTEPKILPARTVVYVDAVFDNSARNSFNPGPDKTVYWGDYSFDEMLVGYMSFQYGRKDVPDAGQLSMR